MALIEELEENFQAANFTPNREVLNKCAELCLTYNLSGEEFADQFFAYTVSHLNGQPPTIENLDQLERRELQKQARNPTKTPKKVIENQPKEVTPKTPVRTPQTVVQDENTPTQRYSQRGDSRSVQSQFSELKFDNWIVNSCVTIQLLENMKCDVKFMYEKFSNRGLILDHMTKWIAGEILKEKSLEITEQSMKNYSGEMVVCGRIYSESGRLNTESVMLEGTRHLNRGNQVKLNLAALKKIELFNGQIVVIEGNNTKNNLLVTALHSGTIPAIESHPELVDPLRIIAAAGPFSLPDNLQYQPLNDLIDYVIDYKPNVLILIGPFIEDGHMSLEDLPLTYNEFFRNLLDNISNRIPDSVQIIIMSSHKDAHYHQIYPTPPYNITTKSNIILSQDPGLIEINGVVIGATSVDTLFHLNKNELYKDQNSTFLGDKMSRLSSYLIRQRSFYPIHPSDLDTIIDYQLMENYGMLERTPHILILPSNFRNFIKNVGGCMVINPERLTKGNVAGTFVKIEVQPGAESVPICERFAGQVLRV